MSAAEATSADTPPSDGEVCSLVNELSASINRHVRRVAEAFGLTEAQAMALRELPEPCTLRTLANRLCCEAPNATFVADRLESLGLLTRGPHPTDRRAKLLHLTERGQALRAELMDRLRVESPLQRLPEDDQVLLRDLLARATRGPQR